MAKLPITHTASIYQLKRTGNTESYQSTPSYTNVNICVSPTGTDIQNSEGGVPSYQLFEIFLYDITLSLTNGDKIITDGDNQEYLLDGKPYVINNQYLSYIRILARQVV